MLLLRNLTLADSRRALENTDVLLDGDKISAIGQNLPRPRADHARVIDGRGLVLMPSFVDLHAHFRDPGLTHKEDVETGCRAAAHGGYTAVNLMPNTKPVCSDMETVRYVEEKARSLGLCDVFQTASITRGFDSADTSHIDALTGVKWLTDDGFGVNDTAVILEAMEKAKAMGMGLMLHEEDGALAKRDSLFSEELPTFRDVRLAMLTGCRTHFCHVSTKSAMGYLVEGKRLGAPITCEVSPHHLALNDETDDRVNPPLRPEEHRLAMIEAVKAGHVDAIATDHAPHAAEEKAAGMNGFTGLDLAFATCYTTLVRPGHIDLRALSRLMSLNPARLMGLSGGLIEQGAPANLVLAELDSPFIAEERHIHSKSKNSPMLGKELYGQIRMTIWKGRIVYEQGAD